MRVFSGLFLAAVLISPTWAGAAEAPAPASSGSFIMAEGGCGPDYHRDDYGHCRPNWREREGRECPRGYHFDRGRCWPN